MENYSKVIGLDGVTLEGYMRLSDGAFVPIEPLNRDYQKMLEEINGQ